MSASQITRKPSWTSAPPAVSEPSPPAPPAPCKQTAARSQRKAKRPFPVASRKSQALAATLVCHCHQIIGRGAIAEACGKRNLGRVVGPTGIFGRRLSQRVAPRAVGVSARTCYLGAPFHHVFTHFKLEATPVYAQCSENRPALPTVKVDDEELRWFSLQPVPSVGCPLPLCGCFNTLGNDA